MSKKKKQEYTIRLPKPHAKQRAFRASKAKRKVIVAGRRGGKTTGVSLMAVEAALAGRRVLEAAPTYDQTEAFWEACKKFLAEPIAAGVVSKNESRRVLELPNGGRIRSKTAWDADSLRGDHADLLILDEYSIMDPAAWSEVGAPMLLDNGGDAVFIFTPKRKNHAWKLYQRARADETGRWDAFHFVSADNPHLDREALQEITLDMTEASYKQEILAVFLDSEGLVFRNIPACLISRSTTPDLHRDHIIVAGVDWGRLKDFTVISVFCVTCGCEVDFDRFNKISWKIQRGRLVSLYEKWSVSRILAESNSIGGPNIEALQEEGLEVEGFAATGTSKAPLIDGLVGSFEREEAAWLDIPVATIELESYEQKTSATGHIKYGAPSGMHDDTVIARALARRASLHTSQGVF